MRLTLIVNPIFIEISNLEVLYSKLVVNTLLRVQHSILLKSSQQICISTLKADFCLLRKNCLIKWLNKVAKHFSQAGYRFFSKYRHSKFKNFNSQNLGLIYFKIELCSSVVRTSFTANIRVRKMVLELLVSILNTVGKEKY